MILTPRIIYKLYPQLDWGWYDAFSLLNDYDINTPLRLSHFLAQTSHESADFTRLVENLNYSEKGLLSTFPKYFTPAQAAQFARKPQAIANRVYANRLGNGPESSGDGWKYRGRGAIQVTGKTNYKNCSEYLFNDDILLTNPDLLLEPKYAILSACWYWDINNLNKIADGNNIELLTRKINGGLNGLEDRRARFGRIYSVLNS